MTNCLRSRASIVGNPIHRDGFATLTTQLTRVRVSAPCGSRTRPLGNSRVYGVRASAVESYEGSSNFVKRMEKAWLISKASLFLAITCFAKSLKKVLVVSYVLGRDLCDAQIVREQVFVPSGQDSLLYPSSRFS